MYKNNKLIIAKFLLIVSLLSFLLACIYFAQVYLSNNEFRQSNDEISGQKKIIDRLSRVWINGDLNDLTNEQKEFCSDLVELNPLVSSEFYQCNPLFINCYLHNFSDGKYQIIKQQKYYFEFAKNGDPIISLQSESHELFKIKLLDTCSDVYLPQKKYSAGPRDTQKYIWDNFDQNIYIDKYYVSNLDVYLWKTRKNIPFNRLEKNIKKEMHRPNTSLSTIEKNTFCYHHGKKVLEGRYFDAASFIPEKDDNPKLIKKFPYHWTKKRQVEKMNCYDVYSRECESQREYKFYEGLSTGWTGIHFVLGNYMEYLPNKFVKDKNLKVSSFYLSANNSWHEIGKRGTLGKTDLKYFQDQQGVAFRCMSVR